MKYPKRVQGGLHPAVALVVGVAMTQGDLCAGLYSRVDTWYRATNTATATYSESSRFKDDAEGALVSDSATNTWSWYLNSEYLSRGGIRDPYVEQFCGTGGVAFCTGSVTWSVDGRAEAQHGQLRSWARGELEVSPPFSGQYDNLGTGYYIESGLSATVSQSDSITFTGARPGSVGYATFYWRSHAEISDVGFADPASFWFFHSWFGSSGDWCVTTICAASVSFTFGEPLYFDLTQRSKVLLLAIPGDRVYGGRRTVTVDAFNTVSLERIVVRDAEGRAVPNLRYTSESTLPYDVSTPDEVPEPATMGLLFVGGLAVAAAAKIGRVLKSRRPTTL